MEKNMEKKIKEIMGKHERESDHHVKRVSENVMVLASLYGLPEKECHMLKVASSYHDIGKYYIPELVLNKPGPLTYSEYELVKQHTVIGYKILKQSDIAYRDIAANIALTHHERYDGAGYPNGLKGENIPLYGRIVAVIDVFDALISKRVYKRPWPEEKVIEYMDQETGKHFDPELMKIFLSEFQQFVDIWRKYHK